MARWLAQQFALANGIAAHFAFPLPASFIWNIFELTLGDLPDLASFSKETLLWRIMAELDALLGTSSMMEVTGYLNHDGDSRKKFQLAGKITDLFDQYLVYRPKMLLAWEQGQDSHWQATLWRRLVAKTPSHRAQLLQQYIAASDSGTLRAETLPERTCLFAINSLAPAYLEVLVRLSDLIDLHVFHLSPCRQAWDDILPETLLAIKRQSWRSRNMVDVSGYFTTGNPLLASMGSMGSEFFSQLMELNPIETALYDTPEGCSLLSMIQGDILDLEDRTQTSPALLAGDDHSIDFHCCHSPMREVQVLHDRLLDLFAQHHDIKPADILVMAPDINLYAPFINGVFGSAGKELYIPWSIADRLGQYEYPLFEAFLYLLSLASSRFTAPEVMVLLEYRAVQKKFQLQEDDVAAMRDPLVASGIRWGLDARQKQFKGRDDSGMHTWEFGLERLLLGYLMGPQEHSFLNILPYSSRIDDFSPWLGNLTQFIRALQWLEQTLRLEHTPEEWGRILLQLLTFFFSIAENDAEEEGLFTLREAIQHFVDNTRTAGFNNPISLSLLRNHFERQLAQPTGGQAFLSGRVTFCNMVPMRSVPFKIIWLLGMNDMDYPRSQKPLEFDLIAKRPCLGDRSRRDDDRYLFLEAILSARNHLAISWIGRDQQQNTELPPSVVVAELRDYIDRGWSTESKDQKTTDRITVIHPLQPFSPRCFNSTAGMASYTDFWCPTGQQITNTSFLNKPLPRPEHLNNSIEINQLIRFWSHPVRYFLEQRLGLRLPGHEDLVPDSEPFVLDPLQKYLVSQKILNDVLTGNDPQQSFLQAQAAAILPRGNFALLTFQELEETAVAVLQTLQPLLEQPVAPVEINLANGTIRLTGWLNGLYSTGRISYRPASLKAKDLLQLWIQHLLLCLLRPAKVTPISIHVAIDNIVCFQAVNDPETVLTDFVEFYHKGQSEPLHFFPKTSHAWAKAKNESIRMNAAHSAWYSGYRNRGEEEDPAYIMALNGQNPLDEQFQELAALFFPLLNHLDNDHATA